MLYIKKTESWEFYYVCLSCEMQKYATVTFNFVNMRRQIQVLCILVLPFVFLNTGNRWSLCFSVVSFSYC